MRPLPAPRGVTETLPLRQSETVTGKCCSRSESSSVRKRACSYLQCAWPREKENIKREVRRRTHETNGDFGAERGARRCERARREAREQTARERRGRGRVEKRSDDAPPLWVRVLERELDLHPIILDRRARDDHGILAHQVRRHLFPLRLDHAALGVDGDVVRLVADPQPLRRGLAHRRCFEQARHAPRRYADALFEALSRQRALRVDRFRRRRQRRRRRLRLPQRLARPRRGRDRRGRRGRGPRPDGEQLRVAPLPLIAVAAELLLVDARIQRGGGALCFRLRFRHRGAAASQGP